MDHDATGQYRPDGRNWLRAGVVLLAVGLVGLLWLTDAVKSNNLMLTVPVVKKLAWLESNWTYFYLHLFTAIPVLALSFDQKIYYYQKWKYLAPAIGIVGSIFILWDVYFTVRGVWGFNETYLTGWRLLHLPLEEWLFFITVPFACLFIYECLNGYIQRDLLASVEPWLTPLLSLTLLVVGFVYWGRLYTATTFLLTGFFLLYHYLFLEGAYRSRFFLAYLVSLGPFLLVNGVLTGGYTSQPVVIYNPEEYLGVRITSVPLDDAVYGLLLLLGTTTLYEHFQKKVKDRGGILG